MTIEITVSFEGVQAVRVYGRDWQDGAAAYALLDHLSPLIQQIDSVAKQQNSSTILAIGEKGRVQ